MKKLVSIILFLALVLMSAESSTLNAQSINFKLGLFHPSMSSDLWDINMENLALNKQDMRASYFGVEYEHPLNRYVTFTLEGGYYDKEHNSFYKDFEYEDGTPIYQSLALRIINMEAGIKLYPLGTRRNFNPYVGVGGGVYYWKYEQYGDFIDFENDLVNDDEYADSKAYTPGFNARAGFVFRFARNWGLSFEGKYQFLKGELSSFFEGFEKFDLSGFILSAGVNFFLSR